MSFEQGLKEFHQMAQDIKNDTSLTEDQKNSKVIALMKQVNEINYLMQLKITAVDIYKKQMSKNIQKIDNEIAYEKNSAKQAKEQTKLFVSEIKEIKKLHERMDKELTRQNQEIDKKFNELKSKIESKVKFDPKEVDILEEENKNLQEKLNQSIENFEEAKKKNQELLKNLQDEYNQFNEQNGDKIKSLSEEYDAIKVVQKEFQEIERGNQKMVQQIQTISQKITNYQKIMNMKEDTYKNYYNDMHVLFDTSFKIYERQKNLEKANKYASQIIIAIMNENEQLSAQLKKVEKETENAKNLCKQKQEILKNIN